MGSTIVAFDGSFKDNTYAAQDEINQHLKHMRGKFYRVWGRIKVEQKPNGIGIYTERHGYLVACLGCDPELFELFQKFEGVVMRRPLTVRDNGSNEDGHYYTPHVSPRQ